MKGKILLTFLTGSIFLYLTSVCFGSSNPIRIVSDIKSHPNLSLLNETRHSLETAYNYLLETQLPNGSWKDDPSITALVVYSFLVEPIYNPDGRAGKAVSKGFEYLEKFVQPNGGIYRKGYRNYVTAVCLLAFTESKMPKYESIIKNAKNFLIQIQVDEEEGISEQHPYYGGIGYGGDDRPDLSNTHFALEAIKAAEDYEARYAQIIPKNKDQIEKEETELGIHWRKALTFLARCQNVKEINNMPYAENDGGFIYETGHYKEERSHSYGSMTYAGVKSLVYARLAKDDIRVKRAFSWIQSHYTLEENPGFGKVALYYYYMTFAKCLDALGEDVIEDSDGKRHYWREDLIKKLISLQHEDGYWVSEDGRYWHNVKDLVTAYGIISLKFALKGLLDDRSATYIERNTYDSLNLAFSCR